MTDNSAETLASTETSGLEASGESVIALKTNSQVSRPRLLELRGRAPTEPSAGEDAQQELPFAIVRGEELTEVPAVSYTHLTLPTNREV